MFNRVSSVISLFGCGCPSAVAWFIITVWIDAINTVAAGGFWSHIGKEIFKGSFPSLAKSHALIGIISRLRVRSSTSVLHCQPRPKFLRFSLSRCAAVGCHSLCRNFVTKTSATLGFTASKFSCIGKMFFSAIALTKPNSNSSFRASLPIYHDKPSKSLSNKIACSLRGSFRPQATAAFSAAALNSSSRGNSFSSAATEAKPHRLSAFVFNTTNTSESIEGSASKIDLFHLNFLLVFIVANRNRKAIRKVLFYG